MKDIGEIMEMLTQSHRQVSPPNTLSFCTRCGQEVTPYLANREVIKDDSHDDYSEPLQAGDGRAAHAHYPCAACGETWVAFSVADTGMFTRCEHFAPGYAAYCPVCGRAAEAMQLPLGGQ